MLLLGCLKDSIRLLDLVLTFVRLMRALHICLIDILGGVKAGREEKILECWPRYNPSIMDMSACMKKERYI